MGRYWLRVPESRTRLGTCNGRHTKWGRRERQCLISRLVHGVDAVPLRIVAVRRGSRGEGVAGN